MRFNTLIGPLEAAEGAIDAATFLKPALPGANCSAIVPINHPRRIPANTIEAGMRALEAGRFQPVMVGEPSVPSYTIEGFPAGPAPSVYEQHHR